MQGFELSKELSEKIHAKIVEAMIEFSETHKVMSLEVALHGLGSAAFVVIASMFDQGKVNLTDAIIHIQEMLGNMTVSTVDFYRGKKKLDLKTH